MSMLTIHRMNDCRRTAPLAQALLAAIMTLALAGHHAFGQDNDFELKVETAWLATNDAEDKLYTKQATFKEALLAVTDIIGLVPGVIKADLQVAKYVGKIVDSENGLTDTAIRDARLAAIYSDRRLLAQKLLAQGTNSRRIGMLAGKAAWKRGARDRGFVHAAAGKQVTTTDKPSRYARIWQPAGLTFDVYKTQIEAEADLTKSAIQGAGIDGLEVKRGFIIGVNWYLNKVADKHKFDRNPLGVPK